MTAVFYGILLGLGLWILVRGLVNPPRIPPRSELKERLSQVLNVKPKQSMSLEEKNRLMEIVKNVLKVAGALAAGLVVGFGTGWLGAGLLFAVIGWYGPQILLSMQARKQTLIRIESVAIWAEQLRDLVTAGGSVSGSILLSAPYSPEPIRDQVQKLSEETLGYGLPEALKRFAVRCQSPYVDRLSLGLKIADESGAKLRDLLDHLASSLRASVEVRFRTEATQKRTLLNGTLIIGITLALAIVITLLTPDYFNAYYGLIGQTVLIFVMILYVIAIFTILQIDKATEGARLLDHLDIEEEQAELVQHELEQHEAAQQATKRQAAKRQLFTKSKAKAKATAEAQA